MSNDASTSTNISILKNITEAGQQVKVRKAKKWEIDLIGNFVLNLYHRSIITPSNDWSVKKSEMQKEFSQLVTAEIRERLKKLNDTDDVGTLLHRCGFLINANHVSTLYTIRSIKLFEFRKKKLNELDNLRINCNGTKQAATNDKGSDSILLNLDKEKLSVLVEDNFEIDENEAKKRLEYQGTIIQRRENTFCPTNMGCYICQEEFSTMETFEEHIQTHGEDTDFEFLTTMDKCHIKYFTMSYRLCKNSHNFCFEFETSFENLIIEKIIIVQSRSFFYVNNMRVPYKCPENGMDRFFVDSHLFTIYVEQPIVLICHLEDNKDLLIIEQHHFMRSEEFPKVHLAINPNRLPNKKTFKHLLQLADYFPPKQIQDALKDDFYSENLMKISSAFRDYVCNEKNLQPQTLAASLNILLQIEDMDTMQQYLSLKQENIKLLNNGDEYSFRLKPKQRMFVKDILTAYDELILTTRPDIFTKSEEIMKLIMQNNLDIKLMNNTFVGQVQAVNTGRIRFKCDQKIDIHGVYTVIFRPSRLNFRYQYRSLQLLLPSYMHFLSKFLFPTKIIPMPLPTLSLTLYNENINGEQLQAVRNIAQGPRNDATYIIFGPPGTGKTTTLVEGILQILKKPDTKVLVTASSNSACDEIALRLCKYLKQLDIKRPMVRIYSRSCEDRAETIDDELLENSNMYNGQFYPDVEILHEYRVVICTLSVVAKLSTGKFGRKENGSTLYTHLFIDEVAASMETEALLAITTILTSNSCLIISGDHKQLGPILQSRRAIELGLDASLMDRLLKRDCYRVDVDTGVYDRTIQTRLVRNFRSHPAIVNLYSGLYYNHTLESFAKRDDVSLCEIWHKSRNKEFPIIFHAIHEPSKSDNHSLYNLQELHVVMDYVKDLMYFGINGEPVKESDIGIISPYKRQYKRIQEKLNLRKWFGIETGSVETFQGKEKNIIIVSFVRSGTKTLGFLDNPRRLNVTLSRPKSLLILIGNPKTLSSNNDFAYIIEECQRNNTFVCSNGPTKRDKRKQPTVNNSKSLEKLSQLNTKLQALSIDNKEQKKMPLLSQKKRRRGCRGKRKSRSNNREKSYDENGVDAVVDNDIDKPTTTSNNSNLKKINSRKGYEMRQSKKSDLSIPGKNSKQVGIGGQINITDRNANSIFDGLLKVPETTTKTTANYTKMQNQNIVYTNNSFRFNLPTTSTTVVSIQQGATKKPPQMPTNLKAINTSTNISCSNYSLNSINSKGGPRYKTCDHVPVTNYKAVTSSITNSGIIGKPFALEIVANRIPEQQKTAYKCEELILASNEKPSTSRESKTNITALKPLNRKDVQNYALKTFATTCDDNVSSSVIPSNIAHLRTRTSSTSTNNSKSHLYSNIKSTVYIGSNILSTYTQRYDNLANIYSSNLVINEKNINKANKSCVIL